MSRESEDKDDDFAEMIKLTMEGRAALDLGEPVKALELLRKKQALIVKTFGENSVFAATSGVDLGSALLECGEYEEAGELLRWSVARYRELDINDKRAITAMSQAAMAAYQAADYGSAEVQLKALIADLRGRGGEFEVSRAQQQDHLAQVLLRQERYDEAEPLLVEALSVFERSTIDEYHTATCLSLLGRLYSRTYRFREAEAVHRRALALFEQTYGEDFLYVAKELDHLAISLAMRAQSENKRDLAAEAVSLGERAVRIFTANLPPWHPSVFGANQNLNRYRSLHASIGMMYPNGGDDASEQAAARVEPRLPNAHPEAVMRLVSAAKDAAMNRNYAKAQAMISEATTVAVKSFGDGNPMAHHVRAAYIEILRRHCSFLLGEPTGQLLPSEHFYMQMRAHMRRGQADDDSADLPPVTADVLTEVRELITKALRITDELIAEAINEDGTRKAGAGGRLWVGASHVGDVLEVLHYARLVGVISSADAWDRASTVMQLHGWHSTAETLGTSLDRDTGTPEVRAAREEYRASLLEYEIAVEQMVQRAMGRAETDAPASDYDVEKLSRAYLRVEELRRKLGDSAGSFEESGASRIYLLSAIQARLHVKGEAVISYLVGSRAVFIVAVTGEQHAFVRVEFESELVRAMCDMFRESIDLDLSTGSALAFDVQQALSLHDVLIRPLEKYLDDISHLLIVPDGPLWSISFEALLRDLEAVEESEDATDSGEGDDQDDFAMRLRRLRRAAALSKIDDPCAAISRADAWVGSRYAVSVLPSIGALSGRDSVRRGSRPSKSFLGFGNPLFWSPPAEEGSLAADKHSTVIKAAGDLVPLPQTERLLDQIAKILGADLESDVFVRSDASVRRVLELNEAGELANRRIICFATHAVYPTADGDTLQEPGLVLAAAEAEAPSVLLASQVRQLQLNADFVLLTACFTGAPAGKSINVPLSGLAQSFFTAGAKCLLVSNWPVDVYATEALVRAMFSSSGEEETLAEALQRAAKALRRDARQPHFSHPVYWAGFSIVGDGGTRIWS